MQDTALKVDRLQNEMRKNFYVNAKSTPVTWPNIRDFGPRPIMKK